MLAAMRALISVTIDSVVSFPHMVPSATCLFVSTLKIHCDDGLCVEIDRWRHEYFVLPTISLEFDFLKNQLPSTVNSWQTRTLGNMTILDFIDLKQ